MSTTRSIALTRLSHDHHHGLVLSDRLQKRLEKPSLTEADRSTLVAMMSDFYNEHLVPHFQAEEKALFPFMRRHLGEVAVISELLQEHRVMTGIMEECRSKGSGIEVNDHRQRRWLLI